MSLAPTRVTSCSGGVRHGTAVSQSSPADRRSSMPANAANMPSRTPGGKSSSTASQLTSSPPSTSTTWWSSQTCGVCDTPQTGSAKRVPVSAPSSPVTPSVLVNTTGMVTSAEPVRLASSRITHSAETSLCSRSRTTRRCRRRALSSQVSPGS